MNSRDVMKQVGVSSIRQLMQHNKCDLVSVRQQIQIASLHQRYLSLGGGDYLGVPLGPPVYANGLMSRSYGGGDLKFLINGPQGGDDVLVARIEVVGIECLRDSDSDQGTTTDEPYFQIAVIGEQGKSSILNLTFENIDDGDIIDIGQVLVDEAKMISPPLHIQVNAMEHDQGNRQDVENVFNSLVKEWEGAAKAAVAGATGFTLPEDTGYTSNWLKKVFSSTVLDIFNWQDDKIGHGFKNVWTLDATKAAWEPLPMPEYRFGNNLNPYNLRIVVGEDKEGTEGQYAVYFLCELRKITPPRPV